MTRQQVRIREANKAGILRCKRRTFWHIEKRNLSFCENSVLHSIPFKAFPMSWKILYDWQRRLVVARSGQKVADVPPLRLAFRAAAVTRGVLKWNTKTTLHGNSSSFWTNCDNGRKFCRYLQMSLQANRTASLPTINWSPVSPSCFEAARPFCLQRRVIIPPKLSRGLRTHSLQYC